jgi:hypothetical protein
MSHESKLSVRKVQSAWTDLKPVNEQAIVVATPRPVANPAPGSFMRPLDVSTASERVVNAPKEWGRPK